MLPPAQFVTMPPSLRHPLDQRILELLADGQPRSTTDLAAHLATDALAIRVAVRRLKDRRRIRCMGYRLEAPMSGTDWTGRKQIHHAVWTLSEHG